jgi:hypothetical protein
MKSRKGYTDENKHAIPIGCAPMQISFTESSADRARRGTREARTPGNVSYISLQLRRGLGRDATLDQLDDP